jgi:hypothetical protein
MTFGTRGPSTSCERSIVLTLAHSTLETANRWTTPAGHRRDDLEKPKLEQAASFNGILASSAPSNRAAHVEQKQNPRQS